MLIAWNGVNSETQKIIEEYYQQSKSLKELWNMMKTSKHTVTITLRGSQLAEKYAKDKQGNPIGKDISFVAPLNQDNSYNGIGTDCVMAFDGNKIQNGNLWKNKDDPNHWYKYVAAGIAGHEGAHTVAQLFGIRLKGINPVHNTPNEEIRAMGIENKIRGELGIEYNNHYPSPSGPMSIPLGPIVQPLKDIFNRGK